MLKNPVNKLKQPDYKIRQNQLITHIIEETRQAPNEATVASIFERLLSNHLSDEFLFNMNITKEVTVNDGLSKHFNGRLDGVVSNLIIEYKRPSKLRKKEDINSAIEQLKGYLNQLSLEGKIFTGFLTDGSHYVTAYYSGEKLIVSTLRPLDSNGINFLIQEFLNLDKKQLISKNLQNDFGSNSILEHLQQTLYRQLSQHFVGKSEMLFEEWMDIFHLSLNDDGKSNTLAARRDALSKAINSVLKSPQEEYMALFSMQTAYAIVLKIFALKILPKIDLNAKTEVFEDLLELSPNELQNIFRSIEDGYIFQTANVSNLLEGDFYSWYVQEDQWSSDVAITLKKIILIVSEYADASLSYKSSSSDLFKDLYMVAIPGSVRKAFGEVFTPDWLADQVIRTSIAKVVDNKPEWTFLDPTAGSGTFLLRAINIIVEEGLENERSNSEILTSILTRISGIDLNPLSVLAGRVGYLLAIRPFMDGRSIEIPFYLGDSARLPQKYLIDGVNYVGYEIETQKANINITLPQSFVASESFLKEVYSWQTYIKLKDSELLYDAMKKNFSSPVPQSIDELIKKTSKTLVNLEKQNWDGIWLKIVSNFVLTTRINKVDIIAGNPPWVKWENLPTNYSLKIKDIARPRNLFSGKNKGLGGAINLNLAALISNVAAFQWLSNDGILGFLMPDTLLNSDSYEGWRRFSDGNGHKIFLNQIDDWSEAGSPFYPVLEKFLAYYITKKPTEKIQLKKYKKNFPRKVSITDVNENKSWTNALEFYEEMPGEIVQLSSNSNRYSRIYERNLDYIDALKLLDGKNSYKPRQGVELTPLEVYIFNRVGDHAYSNIRKKATKIKAKHFDGINLEDSIMKPLLQSKNVGAFSLVNDFDYGLIPYNEKQEIYDVNQLNKKYPLVLEYLVQQKSHIDEQSERSKMMARGEEFYALSKIGPYSIFDYAVVFRDNTQMKASFVDNSRRKKPLFPVKHAPFISRDINDQPLSRDEALYLTGILNLPIVSDYFKVTYSERSFSINFDLNIPKFDSKNSHQVKMAKYSDLLVENMEQYSEDEVRKIILKIQNEYIALIKSTKKK